MDSYFQKTNINQLVGQHETWRANCLNLCAAENAMSPAVRRMLGSDLAQRYGDYVGRDLTARKYFGTREVIPIEQFVAQVAADLFQAKYVELRPLSGHTAGNAVIMGLCRPGDLVLELDRHSGGHRLASKLSASPLIALRVDYLPFDAETFNVDVDRTMDLIERERPRLVILGASNFLFPAPVRELAHTLKAFPETVLVYDASHVLGLIAGHRFQAPLAEGAHLVLAGTQKSFPGPQGGLIYTDSQELMDTVCDTLFPALISNHHLARLPSLGLALLEMTHWGEAYADQIIRNAQALGAALEKEGLPVVASELGYTQSHTVLINTSELGNAEDLGRQLDDADLIVTSIRLPEALGGAALRIGVQEVTRRGAEAESMAEIARLLADLLLNRRSAEQVSQDVAALARTLDRYRYTWDETSHA